MTFLAKLQLPEGIDADRIRELTQNWPQTFAQGFDWTKPATLRRTELVISLNWEYANSQSTRYHRWNLFDGGLLVEEFQEAGAEPDLSPHFEEHQYRKVGPRDYLLMVPVYDPRELMTTPRKPVLSIVTIVNDSL